MENCGFGSVVCRTWLNVRVGRRVAGLLGGLALCIVMQGNWAARAQDITPPTLTGLSFGPSSIDTSSAPATVTFSFTATDDLSGVRSGLPCLCRRQEMRPTAAA